MCIRDREITPTGVVSTLAGSSQGYLDATGTAAQFDNPKGVAVDSSGNLYVADTFNNHIRKITPTGVVTTIAGDGTEAQFNGPIGVAVDGDRATARLHSPNTIAVDSDGNLYVVEDSNRIREITPGGVVSTLAGSTEGYLDATGTKAQFDNPLGVTWMVTAQRRGFTPPTP